MARIGTPHRPVFVAVCQTALQSINMKKLFFLIIAFVFLSTQSIEAQRIKRSTLCSVAKKSTNIGSIKIASTMGQNCISCSVLTNDENFVRQGFQQPPASKNDRPCGFDSGMEVEVLSTNCGTYFNFEYTGLGDPSTATFLWDFGEAATPQTSTELNPMEIAYSETGNKFVSLTIEGPEGCSETVSRIIQVTESAFAANILTEKETCFGDADGSVTLDIFNGTAPYNVAWGPGASEPQLTNLKAGNYPFTITDSEGCTWENIAIIDGPTEPLSIMTIAKVPESCSPESDGRIIISPQGGTTPYSIEWSNGKTGETIDSLSASAYTVIITDDHGCTVSGGYEIFELCKDADKILYDVLTPNNDGQNDIWVIEGIENYPNNVVQVYNRWGNMVWNQSSYTNDWDGLSNKGKKLPAGGYYYIVRLNDADNTTIGGSITILR